jgi:tripartite-type tricarboxylate transporter receptor subunit TctC
LPGVQEALAEEDVPCGKGEDRVKRVSRLVLLGIAMSSALSPQAAAAQNFPVKPIRFVIGPAPDLLPRLVGQKLAEGWGQQVVVDQRQGAAGAIAGEIVAKAPPDGYTWLMSSASFVIISGLYPKLPYDFMRDFTPVTLMATLPFIVVVHPSVPAKSLAELIQLARAKPGQLNYASAGSGTSTHLVTEMFRSMARIDIVHVPYKGVVPAITDVLGGQVQIMFAIAQAGVPHVQSGKLRALAITSTKRSLAVPEVPTIAESGFPDIDVVGWNGVHVPSKTPRDVIAKINGDIAKILKLPEVRERMVAAGFEPAMTSVGEFAAFVNRDVQRYTKVIKESRIRVD